MGKRHLSPETEARALLRQACKSCQDPVFREGEQAWVLADQPFAFAGLSKLQTELAKILGASQVTVISSLDELDFGMSDARKQKLDDDAWLIRMVGYAMMLGGKVVKY